MACTAIAGFISGNTILLKVLNSPEPSIDAQSTKVGSKECEEGKIFIEPQGFCVMAGIGIIHGYLLQRLCLEEEIVRLISIARYVHLMLKKSVRSTGRNHMYIHRWLREQMPRVLEKRRTAS